MHQRVAMANWQVVLVVLAAVVVGSSIPVLFQLRATLRQMALRMGTTGTRLDKTLDEALATAERINRLVGGLDGGEKQLARLLVSMEQLAQVLDKVKSTVNVASAVGAAVAPAVAALVRSLGEHHEVPVLATTKSNGG